VGRHLTPGWELQTLKKHNEDSPGGDWHRGDAVSLYVPFFSAKLLL